MASLQGYLRNFIDTSLLTVALEQLEKPELLNTITEYVSRNLPDIVELAKLFNTDEILLIPVISSQDKILVLASSDREFNNAFRELTSLIGDLTHFTWRSLAELYRKVLPYNTTPAPLVDIVSLVPLVPLSPYELDDLRELISRKLMEKLPEIQPFSPTVTDNLLLKLIRRIPVLIDEERGYIPLLKPRFQEVENGLDLLYTVPSFLIKGELNIKRLRSMDEYEIKSYMHKLLDQYLATRLVDMLARLYEPRRSIIKELSSLYTVLLSISFLADTSNNRITIVNKIEPALDEENKKSKSISFTIESTSKNKHRLVIRLCEDEHTPLYPTVVFYPQYLGKRGENLSKIIAVAVMLGLEDLLHKLLPIVDKVDDIEIKIMKHTITPAVPANINEIIIVRGAPSILDSYPPYYNIESSNYRSFRNVEELYNWFIEEARKHIYNPTLQKTFMLPNGLTCKFIELPI